MSGSTEYFDFAQHPSKHPELVEGLTILGAILSEILHFVQYRPRVLSKAKDEVEGFRNWLYSEEAERLVASPEL
jgi:hypothetical protein